MRRTAPSACLRTSGVIPLFTPNRTQQFKWLTKWKRAIRSGLGGQALRSGFQDAVDLGQISGGAPLVAALATHRFNQGRVKPVQVAFDFGGWIYSGVELHGA